MRMAPKVVFLLAVLLALFTLMASMAPVAASFSRPAALLALRFPAIFSWIRAQIGGAEWTGPRRQLVFAEMSDHPPARRNFDLPAGYAATTSGGRLVFSHIADGPIGVSDRFYRTTFILLNDSNQNASGTIKFFDNSGQPLSLSMDGKAGTSFPFSLAKGVQRRFITSGGGDFKSGWALIETDQPVSGTSSFEIRDPGMKVYGDVGVSESFLGTKLTIFADTMGPNTNTGLALVNPSAADANNLLLELYDPRGQKLVDAPFSLGPRGHTAQFLDQFFPNVTNILEFEGTMVITSLDNREFGGITLRITGDQMTSLPVVAPPAGFNSDSRLYFPQVADGLLGGRLRYTTSIILFNNTANAASGTVEFFKSDKNPMNVTIGGITAATFSFNLNPGGVTRMLTSGAGEARIGWARVKMNQPLSGSAMFQVLTDTGVLTAEVGVASAIPTNFINVIADTIGNFDTGVAIANPSENNQSIGISLQLISKSGASLDTYNVNLAAGQHTALVLNQLFPNARNINEFEGRIKIMTSGAPIVPLTLRLIDDKLTSVPVLWRSHGFTPSALVEPVQNLAGTMPAWRWQTHQHWDDLAISSIRLSAPSLGLNTTGLRAGDELGYGIFMMDINGGFQGGVVKLTATGLQDGVDFIISSADGLLQNDRLQMRGKIRGTATGGLTMDMSSRSAIPRSTNGGIGLDMDFFLRSNLIVAPAGAGSINLTTIYTSSSTKLQEADVPIQVQIIQPVSFVAPDSTRANLASLAPVLPGPGSVLTLSGSNFGSNPKMVFTPPGGNPIEWYPVTASAGSITTYLPPQFGEGTVRVDNGLGPGNAYYVRSLFAPDMNITLSGTGSEVPLTFTITLGSEQLGINGFIVNMTNVDRDLAGLAAASKVGTYRFTGGSDPAYTNTYDILVSSSAADKLVLDVSGMISARLTIQKIAGTPPGLSFTFAPNYPMTAPLTYKYPAVTELQLSGLPFKLSLTSPISSWNAEIQSVPAGFTGLNSTLVVILP
jgi:hypothetical protein